MSEILIATDAFGLAEKRHDYDVMKGLLQAIVTQFYTMTNRPAYQPTEDFVPWPTADFRSLITDPATYIAGVTYGDGVQDAFNYKQMLTAGLLNKPVGYDALIAAIADFKTRISTTQNPDYNIGLSQGYSFAGVIKSFEINNHGDVALLASVDAALVRRFSGYASSTTAQNALTLANSILDQLESLDLMRAALSHREGLGGFVRDLLYRENQYGPLVLNVKGILSYNNQ